MCYVPPHGLAAVLRDAAEVLGRARRCAVAREMTKAWSSHLRRDQALFDVRCLLLIHEASSCNIALHIIWKQCNCKYSPGCIWAVFISFQAPQQFPAGTRGVSADHSGGGCRQVC